MEKHLRKQELIDLLRRAGIQSERVLAAMAAVPREQFVSEALQDMAYFDEPLPIGHEQTISQPYVVARMTELLLRISVCHRVLEVGTGSGYQTAVLAQLVPEVYTIERVKPLYVQACQRFQALEYHNIHMLYGDGHLGWSEHSPYDGILVTAAAKEVPAALTAQLADGGCLIIPLPSGYGYQVLSVITKQGNELVTELFDPVLFVPMRPGLTEY